MKKPRKKHLTEKEIDELVVSEAKDPSAWGKPILVGPSKSPRPAWVAHAKHLELSAKFYVLSLLHRMGADATVSFTQPENVDITVIKEPGVALTLDIKTLTGPMEWRVQDFRAQAQHYLMFVWFPRTTDPSVPPNVYIVASDRLKRFVTTHRSTTVPLTLLEIEMSARDAWQQLISSSAA
jgi:hypothetical protein